MRVVTIARKPCSEGTVAENVLKHGTSGLNVGATKVVNVEGGKGRTPPNVILVHHCDCKIVGTIRVATGVAVRRNSGGMNRHTSVKKPPMADMGYADKDGKEEIANWQCVDECPVKKMVQDSHVNRFFTQVVDR